MIARDAVRALLVDPAGRVLLFGAIDPDDGRAFWFAPGGGIEAGEDVGAAAAREVAEETGLRDLVLGPEVWRRRHVFTWRGVEYDQRERWHLARVEAFVADGAGRTDAERADLLPPRWWTPAELDATADRLVPGDLAALLRALLRDGPPETPLEVGV